jgi:hypothetical protein
MSSGAEEDLLPSSAERGAAVSSSEALEGEPRSALGLGLDLRCWGFMGRQRGLTARGSELESSRVWVSTLSRRTHTSSHLPQDVRPADPRLRSRSHVSLRRTLVAPPAAGAADTHTEVRSYQGTLPTGNQKLQRAKSFFRRSDIIQSPDQSAALYGTPTSSRAHNSKQSDPILRQMNTAQTHCTFTHSDTKLNAR